MRVVWLTALMALMYVGDASAQVRPLKGQLTPIAVDTCANLKNSTERAACLAPQLEQATASLTATYTAIRSHFQPGAAYVTLFDASHDGWAKEMVQTCRAAEQFYEGGSIAQAIGIECRLQMTRDRDALLKKLYHAPLNN